MSSFRQLVTWLMFSGVVLHANGESTFAGSSMTSDGTGTRSVLVSGRNGAGVVQTRVGGGTSGISVRTGSPGGGTYASTRTGSPGGPVVFAGPAGAYAGPGGAYASAGGGGAFPYWNGAGSGAYAGAGDPGYYQYDEYPSRSDLGGGSYSGGSVYSSSDSNGIQSRFASVGPGGQATIVEQNGNEPPRVYTYKGRGVRSILARF